MSGRERGAAESHDVPSPRHEPVALLRNRCLTKGYERKAANFLDFVLLGCLKILLNHL